ncbi:hypothetical protein BOX15_Mlig006556g1 [Macrostomum lignano]|uniref:WD_REPEATS_REGION domain-containing protein n=1 Tax=Macrostomum lignano TaxID=282301 RepID=A0A267GB79_9PLAT|nr:hypothetical protein BOX15_Mlig006556g1 [Macrostomum lignano]
MSFFHQNLNYRITFPDNLPKSNFKDFEWSVMRLSLEKILPVHSGCVNSVCWSSNGRYLLSGSDDRNVAITSPFSHLAESHSIASGHRANIFSSKFLPMSDDLKILSAAGDGKINLIDLGQASNDGGNVRSYACHRATVFDIVTSPTEADLFLSVSADGTLRQFDVRQPDSRHVVLLTNQHCRYYGYTAAAVHPLARERLFVADKDGYIGEYDRRCIGYGRWVSQSKPVEVLSSKRLVRVTSLSFNPSATQLLASYNGGSLYLFDIKQTVPQSQLTAAPNAGCDPLHGGPLPTDAVPAEDSSGRIVFRFRGDWSDTGPGSEPPSSSTEGGGSGGGGSGSGDGGGNDGGVARGSGDYSERLGQFMMRAYQLNRQRNPAGAAASEQPMDQEGQNPPLPEDSDDTSDEVPAVRQRHSEPPTPAPSSEPHELSNSSSNGAGAASAASVASVPADSAATRAAPCQSNRRGLADSGSQVESATDYPSYPVCRVFQGHRNARTCIQQAAFWGSNYVLSGSDCGHFLVWRASDGRLLNACLADKRVVNRVAPHPSLLYLATSGIDYDVKLWSPIAGGEKSLTSANNDLAGLVKRNQAMLAQTMNTVTVPGSAMLSIMRTLSRLYSHDAQ